jgi:hypothetical protein
MLSCLPSISWSPDRFQRPLLPSVLGPVLSMHAPDVQMPQRYGFSARASAMQSTLGKSAIERQCDDTTLGRHKDSPFSAYVLVVRRWDSHPSRHNGRAQNNVPAVLTSTG